jgi:hypothetical protein
LPTEAVEDANTGRRIAPIRSSVGHSTTAWSTCAYWTRMPAGGAGAPAQLSAELAKSPPVLFSQRLWAARYNSPGKTSYDDAYSVAVSPDGSRASVTGTSSGRYGTVAYSA